jgi:hypothetical protein
VVSFTLGLLYHPEKTIGGHQWIGLGLESGDEKKIPSLPVMEPRSSSPKTADILTQSKTFYIHLWIFLKLRFSALKNVFGKNVSL